MKYIASTLKYIYKNFIYIFLFAIIPGFAFAIITDSANSNTIINCFLHGNIKDIKDNGVGFAGLFKFFSLFNPQKIILSIVCIICVAFFLALLFAFIEKQMRFGRRSLKGIVSRLNDNIVSTFVIVIIFFLVYELWALITSGLLYGIIMTLDNYTVALYIVISLATIVMCALLIYIMTLFFLWLPCLHITGFTFYEGLAYSNQLTADKKGSIFKAIFIPIIFGCILAGVVAFLCGSFLNGWLYIAVVTFLYAVYFLYIVCLMYVIYFDVTNTERADLKKYYNNDDE